MKTLQEDLRDWFSPTHPKGGWKRINSKGEAIGPCAREPGEPKPKCMSNAKRASLTKNQRASAVRTKRKHDPNPERKGQPIMVSNYGKGKISEEYEIDAANGLIESMDLLLEKNKPTSPDLWADCIRQAKAKFDVYPCVPLDSMAVTRFGPAYRDELKVGDEILTYNIEKDRLEWKPILNLHDFEDAPLVEMKKPTGFKIRCTPNHKWVVQYGIDRGEKFVKTELLETQEILARKNHKRIVTCAVLEDTTSSQQLSEWSKRDLWTERVLGMSKDQREVFLASAIVYDGHDQGVSTKITGRHTLGFSQKNEDHFWSAILAAYLNGYHVSYRDKKAGDSVGMRGATIIRNKKHHSLQNVKFTQVDNEAVWCPETENNTWVMIQNGFITITGNSAYANGWAAQCYKRKGGKWKSVNEEKKVFSEFLNKDSILRQIKEGKTKKVNKQKSRDWKDEQFLKGLESGKKISELLGGRKLTTADGKPVRMGRKVTEAVDKESMPCNKPRASTSPGKKKMVKACEGGQEKIIHYGAKGYGHNYSPAARKSFRARHSCEEKKTKLGAQHWACKDLWAGKGGSTKSCPEGRKCKY